jgi:hypothetical protein
MAEISIPGLALRWGRRLPKKLDDLSVTAAQCDVEACNIVVVFVVQRDVAAYKEMLREWFEGSKCRKDQSDVLDI